MIRPSAERGDVVAYDFRRPSRIAPDRQRNLQASHEQLAQALQRWLSNQLRAPFEVHLESIGQAAYHDFVDGVADPGATFLYDIAGLPGQLAAVYVDPTIAFLLIERLLGGNTVTEPPDRAMTALETVVTRIVTDRVARESGLIWRDHMELEFAFARFESARALIEMTGRDEDVLITTLRVEFQDVKGVIHVALPFPVLESYFTPAQTRLAHVTKAPAERATEKRQAEQVVRKASVVVAVRLPGSKVTLGRLSQLKPGDFLTTSASATDPVEVLVSDTVRFRGRQGRLGPRMGVQITDLVQSE
jgi:flagellar motor switch protein FliM